MRQTMKMTHMEVFYYPVWDSQEEKEMLRCREPVFVLFDYAKRDALTGAAQTEIGIFKGEYYL